MLRFSPSAYSGNTQRDCKLPGLPYGRPGGLFPCFSAISGRSKLVLPIGWSGAIKASDFRHEPLTSLYSH